ncbi:MAG: cytidine/deoxycytidylate deaminase family protein [Peptoniphilaceae bacterium]|nr:cytidine/deoxycytidylate deaminase family protein [Peptoniphilaceae bacterium]MCI6660054.1 cytidine/deoxycytidylate deaminase family protein [Peptoniphilaceae bacterium]MDD7433925.1 cytidine/deoxycytidylate deaminase family protein [Peptoniphilaceae bacterium]MDY3075687.1 cytidine/deoxycytidylate deaminase family protein [Peptoniphilaceae bacterium]MDY3986328.1 cytidine/deoxycytidylate deaminase family protein [Peptoniphilaceae bacterium]
MARQTWNEYFMDLARTVAARGTCDRAYVGCVLVNEEHRIVSTGYNGSVAGNPHCDEIGHTMRDGHCIATIHAEMNALLYCAKAGISVKGCTCYVTHFPCLNCTKALIQSGIQKIYYEIGYRMDPYAIELLDRNRIPYICLSPAETNED